MSFFDRRTPYEKAREKSREISKQIRQEKRQLDRQINQSDREIQRLSTDIRKHAASSGSNKEAIRTLAKAIVKVKHDKSRLYTAKANLDTIDNAVKSQLANVKITGIMQKSNEIVRSMNQLMKVEQLQATCTQFSKEFVKMGIMGEMMSEAVDAALDNDELEEETDAEVAKVIDEVLFNKVHDLPSVRPVDTTLKDHEISAGAVADADSEEEEMERRLQMLKS